MPATTLSHRMFEPIALTLGTVDELMDAVYTMCTATLDVNGDALPSPLVGVGRQATTHAVYGGFTGGSSGIKYLIGGDGVTPPTMRTPDTATPATQTYVGVAKDAGAFTTWTAAAPFTSGAWSNFWRGLDVGTGTLYGWLSGETLLLQRITAAGGSGRGFAVGSWVTAGVDTPPVAEADFICSGMFVVSTVFSTWQSTAPDSSNGGLFAHSVSNAAPHGMIWDGGVGVSTTRLAQRGETIFAGGGQVNALGDIFLQPMTFVQPATIYKLGILREGYFGPQGLCGQVLQVGGADFAYLHSSSTVTVGNTLALLR